MAGGPSRGCAADEAEGEHVDGPRSHEISGRLLCVNEPGLFVGRQLPEGPVLARGMYDYCERVVDALIHGLVMVFVPIFDGFLGV